MSKKFLSFIAEKEEQVVYQSDKEYEEFVDGIKYLPENVRNELMKKYLTLKKNGMNPKLETLITEK